MLEYSDVISTHIIKKHITGERTYNRRLGLVCSGHLKDTACKNVFLLLSYTVSIILSTGKGSEIF